MTMRSKLGALLGAGLLSFALFGTASATGQSVTICHATNSETNPYILESPAINANGAFAGQLSGGHIGHTGPVWVAGDKAAKITWGDIIPAYTYDNGSFHFSFPGYNLPAGQAILDNGCKIPVTPGAAVLSASKAVEEATAAPGGTLHYTIEVVNTGGTDATGVVVTDNITALLAHGTFGTCDNSCAHNATSVSWTVSVPSGGLIDLHYTIVLAASGWTTGTTHLPNTVVVANTNCAANAKVKDPDCSTDTTVTVTPGAAVLSASKAVEEATAAPGGTLHYTIEVVNTGGTDATGVVVTDNITALLAHGTFGTCDNSCAHNATSVSWTVSVPSGGLIDLHYTIVLAASGWTTGTTHLPNTVVVANTNCAANAKVKDPDCSTDTTVSFGGGGAGATAAPSASFGGGGAGNTAAPTASPGGGGAGATQPPTDTLGSSGSGPSDSAWLLVVGLGVLLASVVVLTPARVKSRR
jgi:uncharacterized repeat protein (TIGR01451 family)